MTNTIFSQTLSRGHIYLLPQNTGAVSYTYTSDLLFFNAHMPDKFDNIVADDRYNQTIFDNFFEDHCSDCEFNDGDRCSSYNYIGEVNEDINCPLGHELPELKDNLIIEMGPTVFKQGLKLHGENRFTPCHNIGSFAYLENFRVRDGVIETSNETRGLTNVHTSTQRICWGGVQDLPISLRGLVDRYMHTEHNGDYVPLPETANNCEFIRNYTKNFAPRDKYKFIVERADAFYLVHLEEDLKSYFWLLAAGFGPLPESKNIVIVPLEERTISYDSQNYRGYLTPPDSCGRVWFVSLTGDLVGQVDDSVTVHQNTNRC